MVLASDIPYHVQAKLQEDDVRLQVRIASFKTPDVSHYKLQPGAATDGHVVYDHARGALEAQCVNVR